MYKTIPQLVGEITSLAVLLKSNSEIDVFIYHASHVNELQIEVHLKGWGKSKSPDVTQNLYLDERRNYKNDDIVRNLLKIKQFLVNLSKTHKINFSKLPYEIEEVKSYKIL